jgi:uncharacterized phage protein (TIGR02218 family)
VKRTDGQIFGFTTHDVAIVYDASDGDGPTTYLASSGFTNTATAARADLSVDNTDVTGFLESDSLTESDLRAGRFDDAAITIRIVNWADLTQGDVLLRRGTLGIVKMKRGMFTVEIRGLTHKLTTRIGATYGPICRAPFGSGLNGIRLDSHYLCKFDVVTVRQTGTLAAVLDSRTFEPASGLTGAAGWFNDGLITFTSGAASGLVAEIQSWDGVVLALFTSIPPDVLPSAGDAFTIEPGCNKTIDNCQNKFSNIVNFRGEPFIPGMDQLLDYPVAT